ncbi:MAG: AraC family transcriptional regulator [Bacteroidales bacterium]|nr:AraC family transcriptional regulator [Bacteroidales bacterium]
MTRLHTLAALVDKELKRSKYYLDSRLSADSLSRKIGTNRNYLSRAIFFISGNNFCNYVNQLRIEELLSGGASVMQSKDTLYDAALVCGFNNRRTFYRAFLREKGLSPDDFVAIHKSLSLHRKNQQQQ